MTLQNFNTQDKFELIKLPQDHAIRQIQQKANPKASYYLIK